MPEKKTILCTGGAGYIGAHTAVRLVESGRYKVIVADNLSNSCEAAVDVLKELCGDDLVFVNVDLVSGRETLSKLKFDGVIHFAALKAVGESVAQPLRYYYNNVNSLLSVVNACRDVGCKNFVFSSSATVYRPSTELLTEDSPLGASNPYGQTKVIGEQILRDLSVSDPSWKISILRYFNPVGCHPSGKMGESPKVPQNILPIIQKVAVGKMECVNVCGNDWPTRDGTGIRDYIHVLDLADGHVSSLDQLFELSEGAVKIYNLGTGRGESVLEMISYFEKACGHKIPMKFVGRRPGDLATVVAHPGKAEKELGFKTTRTVQQACEDAWKWQSTHPDGFETRQ
eukprot:Gregarina_sp_Poly_1__1518@NODE_1381_length_4253_cov_250_831104_g925_i0_p2_GENE_NODE_1381_length_4253_cov_250_831104_g925_i0NODE_1381_length_4253_cov_250_831104_g925_i0_p2_ORF_typecomplete_len342_score53_15GDP_Man_Dehyd/PF16363_5/2e78Epimerase/PF01370_21/4_2e483Beta_HSD/PF01073_19/6_8e22RmlD_sub_bind/PF04321_17/4_1e16Polysacc_synt_2/PF02719_15/8_1e15Polysacc_synt_2/PF02719_15/2_7e02NAD_binding_4/PF07993_12/4e15NAD_binding_10/PF13460_6/1_3e06adh_short/PF00106_25/9_9e06KR/PF08659_10/2_5e05NmrA/PF05